MTLPREAGSARRSVGDCDDSEVMSPATTGSGRRELLVPPASRKREGDFPDSGDRQAIAFAARIIVLITSSTEPLRRRLHIASIQLFLVVRRMRFSFSYRQKFPGVVVWARKRAKLAARAVLGSRTATASRSRSRPI